MLAEEATADADADALPVEIEAALNRLGDLVRKFEEHPDIAVTDRVIALLQCVDVIHRAGIREIASLVATAGLQRQALARPEIRLLFDLYDLGDDGERERAEAVLESLRRQLEEQGAHAEVLDAQPGHARVGLTVAGTAAGGCGPDPGPALQADLAQALRDALPDVACEVTLLGAPRTRESDAATTFVPLSALLGAPVGNGVAP